MAALASCSFRMLSRSLGPATKCLAASARQMLQCPPLTAKRMRPLLGPSWRRAQSSVAATLNRNPPAFRNLRDVLNHFLTPETIPRGVFCTGLPKCATDDDVRELFEEDGFCVELILMPFEKTTGLNNRFAVVVLANEKSAKAAMQVLNNAPLFDRRVKVEAVKSISTTDNAASQLGLSGGWTASKDSNPGNAIFRGPCLKRPTNVFQPVREGRRVAFDTLDSGPAFDLGDFYKLLHDYNIECVSKKNTYNRKLMRRHCTFVDFATREDADQAVQIFNGVKIAGSTMEVSKYQIPMKYLGASWDGGLKGGHRSGRDQGSAVGTNYEYVQEELLVKAILGDNDRRRWVPSHTY